MTLHTLTNAFIVAALIGLALIIAAVLYNALRGRP